jgi:hypothetical protein
VKRKNAALILFSLAALLLLTASVLFLVDFNSPEMGKTFMKKLGESTGLHWTAERFRLNLLDGLFLENVTTTGEIAGKRLEGRMKNVTVKHRLLPLLRREISAREILIEDPEVDLFRITQHDRDSATTKRTKETRAKTDSRSPSPKSQTEEQVRVGISQLSVKNALITIHSTPGRRAETIIRSLSMTLNDLTLNDRSVPIIQSFSAKGEVDAEEITIGKIRIEKNEGQIEIAEGEIRAKELNFETEEGKFQADVSLNVKTSPATYELRLKGDPVNTNLVVGGTERDELGPTKLEFQGTGTGSDSRGLRGEGKFTLEDGKVPSNPIFETIERVIGNTGIVGAPYKAGTTPFRIQDNRVQFEGFALHIDQGSLDLSGSVSLDGALRLKCKVRVPRPNVKIKQLPTEVVDALTNDAGFVIIPFRIRGNSQNPIAELDTGALMAQAGEGAKRILKQKLSEKLNDLLKKRKWK